MISLIYCFARSSNDRCEDQKTSKYPKISSITPTAIFVVDRLRVDLTIDRGIHYSNVRCVQLLRFGKNDLDIISLRIDNLFRTVCSGTVAQLPAKQ